MANQAFPNVNGDVCSWADIAVEMNVPGGATVGLVDLEGIKWSDKVEVGEQRGTSGGRVMGQTAGSLSTEASATLSRAGAVQLIEAIEVAALSLPGAVRGNEVIISGVRFDILIQHTPLGSTRIFEAKLSGCRFLGRSHDLKQGNEADMVEITLNPIKVAEKSATGNWIVLR
jgi:hypothetical protein